MRWQDANAKAVGAAFGCGNAALVNVIAVACSPLVGTLIQHRRGGITKVAIVHLAVIGLDAYMLWIKCTQMHARTDLQGFADRNALLILVGDLHVRHLHLRPILAHLRFPLAEMRRGATAILREVFMCLRGG